MRIGGLGLLLLGAAAALILVMLITMYDPATSRVKAGSNFRYMHDEVHRVSCWTFGLQSISCLPDAVVSGVN